MVAASRSGRTGGARAENGALSAAATQVHIRDSKQANGPVLTVGPSAWAGLVGLVAG